ncbi:uncharacterized protein M421DRAFT_8191 [Didymella exigua CBS 183.55]|uniref:RRM domain-containing protein n=1 Tax=Didymella exigua CBS 183.55 TaxID=1150837 RepID=A0A6A5RHM4_9PLEO|nr:uncharacterized protein M421DRAFT_8191 [Didymella exigua CBS 183.55]KAF1925107.1 hypothetical protein M421DRAFT_8191 [Didymella exigua CBS 183.55]
MNRTPPALGDTGHPEDRVIRIVNLCHEADGENVRDFFGDDFTVIDFMRGVKYVLLATEQERINAQALSGGKILDRELATSSYLLAMTSMLEPSALMSRVMKFLLLLVTLRHSLYWAWRRSLAWHLVRSPPHRLANQPAQQRAMQNRLLFMNNVDQGPEVNETSFRRYFGKYAVIDVKRPLDPRSNTPHPTAFLMFSSAEDRDEALHSLNNVPVQGCKVALEVPKTLQNVDE